MGIAGQLDVQLRDTGGTSARMKKQTLEAMKAESQNTYLRTPFGDIYKVSVGNLGIGRIANCRVSPEFCDVPDSVCSGGSMSNINPPDEVVQAILDGQVTILRSVEMYEADNVTRWYPAGADEPVSRLIDGSVTIDYSRAEKNDAFEDNDG